ncbi:unnamed protein product, partial [Polarella glacialis]
VGGSRVTLGRLIGLGGGAKVFRGSLPDWKNRAVAVKEMQHSPLSTGVREQREFDREVAILSEVKHPNIVAYFGACNHEPLRIVMEYCEGGSLFDLLHNSDVDLGWGQKWLMARGVAHGMANLHTQ